MAWWSSPRRSRREQHAGFDPSDLAEMEAVEWFGLLAPAKTPADTIKVLNASVQRALQTDAFKSGLTRQSFDVAGMSQNDFVALIKADTERWGGIVKASGFKPID